MLAIEEAAISSADDYQGILTNQCGMMIGSLPE